MYREMSKVSASAAGTAIQAPLMPRKCGSTSRQAAVKTKVRQNERIADTLPLDNAVKNPEDVMLTPLNKKQNPSKTHGRPYKLKIQFQPKAPQPQQTFPLRAQKKIPSQPRIKTSSSRNSSTLPRMHPTPASSFRKTLRAT